MMVHSRFEDEMVKLSQSMTASELERFEKARKQTLAYHFEQLHFAWLRLVGEWLKCWPFTWIKVLADRLSRRLNSEIGGWFDRAFFILYLANIIGWLMFVVIGVVVILTLPMAK